MTITKLEDAKVLKTMGAPLNTPVEDRFFSDEYSRHWNALMNAYNEFMATIVEVSIGPRAGSLGKWRLAKRRFALLGEAMQRCDALVGRLIDGGEQDQHEAQILALFLTQRAVPFARYWQEAIDAVETGGSYSIKTSDIPPWIDEDI